MALPGSPRHCKVASVVMNRNNLWPQIWFNSWSQEWWHQRLKWKHSRPKQALNSNNPCSTSNTLSCKLLKIKCQFTNRSFSPRWWNLNWPKSWKTLDLPVKTKQRITVLSHDKMRKDQKHSNNYLSVTTCPDLLLITSILCVLPPVTVDATPESLHPHNNSKHRPILLADTTCSKRLEDLSISCNLPSKKCFASASQELTYLRTHSARKTFSPNAQVKRGLLLKIQHLKKIRPCFRERQLVGDSRQLHRKKVSTLLLQSIKIKT